MAYVTIEDRVDRLEALFGQFLTEGAIMRKHADERAKEAERRSKEADERIARLEQEMREFKDEMRGFKDEMLEFKDEMRGFKDGMEAYREESRAERKEMNRQWGALSNKLGHIVEDVMGPNLPRLATEHFGAEEIDWVMFRVDRRDPRNRSRWNEFDAVVSGKDLVLLGEAKSSPEPGDPERFAKKLAEFPHFFPELAGRRVVAVFGSWSVPEKVERRLTELGIYCLQMGEETMVLTNATALESGQQAVSGD
jgi:hypothetical protein